MVCVCSRLLDVSHIVSFHDANSNVYTAFRVLLVIDTSLV